MLRMDSRGRCGATRPHRIRQALRALIDNESGQAGVEYALIAGALIVVLTVAAGSIMQIQKVAYQAQHKALLDWRGP